jgi:hypothetical protein
MAKITRSKRNTKIDHVCQFLIVLPRTDPLVWRRIQVPEAYSFWDLHVAIQDAMGWKDYHLHEFIVVDSRTSRMKRIGYPMTICRMNAPAWPAGRFRSLGT